MSERESVLKGHSLLYVENSARAGWYLVEGLKNSGMEVSWEDEVEWVYKSLREQFERGSIESALIHIPSLNDEAAGKYFQYLLSAQEVCRRMIVLEGQQCNQASLDVYEKIKRSGIKVIQKSRPGSSEQIIEELEKMFTEGSSDK